MLLMPVDKFLTPVKIPCKHGSKFGLLILGEPDGQVHVAKLSQVFKCLLRENRNISKGDFYTKPLQMKLTNCYE